MKTRNLIIFALLIVPVVTFGQGAEPTIVQQCNSGIYNIIDLLSFPICFARKFILPLVITLGVIAFMLKAVKMVQQSDSAEVRKKIPSFLLFAMLGLFAMLSFWAVVRLMGSTIGVGQGGGFNPPQFDQ